MSIVRSVVLSALATRILLRTRTGNGIFAAGGEANAARNLGVPVRRVTIARWSPARSAPRSSPACGPPVGSAGVPRGELEALGAIIAPGIGGCPPTGGHGSAIGASFGVLIVGTAQEGIFATGVDTGRFEVSLGGVLPVAVRLDSRVRREARDGRCMTAPPIDARGLAESVGSALALSGVSMTVRAGEVPCPLGDDGSGEPKPTGARSGVNPPSGGRILVDGRPVWFTMPRDALGAGIASSPGPRDDPADVHHPLRLHGAGDRRREGLFPPVRPGPRRRDRPRRDGQEGGRHAPPDPGGRPAPVPGRLPATCCVAEVPVRDEPTSALGVKQASMVLRYVAQARARNLGVIFITHNVHHAWAVGDRFTVLNRGRTLGTHAKGEIERETLLNMMAGGKELESLSAELDEFARADAARVRGHDSPLEAGAAAERAISETLRREIAEDRRQATEHRHRSR